jgi:hypothetical protein
LAGKSIRPAWLFKDQRILYAGAQAKKLIKKLYLWRFEQAKVANCAVFMFQPDDALAGLAQNKDSLQDILSPEKYRRYGSDLERILQLGG